MMNIAMNICQFALIGVFAIVYMELPENIGKPVSALVLAVFFLLVLVDCMINKVAHLRLYVVKKSEDPKKYYLVLLFHSMISVILIGYFLTHINTVQAFDWSKFNWFPLRWSK